MNSEDPKIRTKIMQALQEIQHAKGFVTDDDKASIAQLFAKPAYMVQDIASFYPHFRSDPPAKCQLHVCRDMACRLRKSAEIASELKRWSKTLPEGDVEVHEVSCLGRCDRAPAAMMQVAPSYTDGGEHCEDKLFVQRSSEELIQTCQAILARRPYEADSDEDLAKKSMTGVEINPYSKSPDYQAVQAYLKNGNPQEVLSALEVAGLLGMGGAGGRAYLKWKDVLQAKGKEKYIVCNGDESEPATFKDRDIFLATPHLVIEGMIVAGLVVGAQNGFVYIRHEYPEQIESVRAEIARAEKNGWCGSNILKSGRSFHLEVFPSPGGYICGEQTALIEAIEGKRGEPRNRPPELQTNGLYDCPTLLNNVETIAWVPSILLRKADDTMIQVELDAIISEKENARKKEKDPAAPAQEDSVEKPTPEMLAKQKEALTTQKGLWYKRSGKGKRSFGKRFFSVCGDVNNPGVYEVQIGITLGELIERCGGMREPLQAVALSGPSSGFLPAKIPISLYQDKLELLKRAGIPTDRDIDVRLLPLDLSVSRGLGYMLGAGITIYGASADMLDQAIACSKFYQSESCGKCVPCRLGSRKIVDLSLQVGKPNFDQEQVDLVGLLSETMTRTSICGLGQVAANPLQSYLKYFYLTQVND